MMQNGFKIGFRLLLAFLTWLSLAPVSANAVLCIGADGHIAVEAAHPASDDDADTAHRRPFPAQEGAHAERGQDHTAPCIDLAAPPGAAAAKSMAQLDLPSFVILPASPLENIPVRIRTFAAPPPPATAPPSPHLAHLKTVLLRI